MSAQPIQIDAQQDATTALLFHFVMQGHLAITTVDFGDGSSQLVVDVPEHTFDHTYPAYGTYELHAWNASGQDQWVDVDVQALAPDVAAIPWRPTIDDVAALIRARTKDASGNEVGTFNADTRPTDIEVERLISNGCAKVAAVVGWNLPEDAWEEAGHLAALLAACEAELSYWPEQVRSDRSPYAQLWAMYQYDIGPFAEFVGQLQPEGFASRQGTLHTPSHTVLWAYEWGYFGPPMSDWVNVGLDADVTRASRWAKPRRR